MSLHYLLIKILILGFFSGVLSTISSSLSVTPSSSANVSVMATSQVNASATVGPGVSVTPSPSSANARATPSQVSATSTAQVGGNSLSSSPTSSSISPSASGSVSKSSSVASFPSLTPEQKKVVDDFLKEKNDIVDKLKMDLEVKPKETSDADFNYMSKVDTLLEKSQTFGKKFNDLNANVKYESITKSNALQVKKFDCVKNRLSTFPAVVNSRSTGAGASFINVPLECPIEEIKEPAASRKRRDVTMSVEMRVVDLPAVIDEEPEEYTHMYRYLRMRRAAQNNQNNSNVCLQNPGNVCLDKRLNVTFRIWNENWKASYANKNSGDFKTLTKKIKEAMEQSVRNNNSALKVNFHSFELRPGSVEVTAYADTVEAMVPNLKAYLGSASSFGSYSLNKTLSVVKQVNVVNGGWTAFTSWPATSPAQHSNCGDEFRVERKRSCTNPSPQNGGKECVGASVETKSCEFGGNQTNGGTISSPYWPNKNYPSNAEGTWLLKAPFNHTVELSIGEFQLEQDKKCFYDYIQIFDGATTKAPLLLPRTCGTGAVNKTIKSTGTLMLVKFRSDRTVTFKGFTASWKKVVKPWIPPKPVQYKEQNVTVTNVISCPTYNNSLVPLGRATTCPKSSGNSECYFEMPSYIIACIIGVTTNRNDLPVQGSAKINMTFKHIMHKDLFPSYYLMKKTCVTWNTSYSNVRASWSRKGCTVKSSNISHTECECEHTGVFTVLVSDKVVHKKFSLLTNTYAGIGVSFFILIVAILHIIWKVDIHGGEVMRINMCVANILMMMTFLIGANVEAEKHLCTFLAFLEYFSVVAQFFWLMLHGLRIHGKIKEVFASGMNIEIVYVGFGWGLPLLLSLIAIGIQVNIENPYAVCWTAIAAGSMWGYGAPLIIVVLLNVFVLCAVVAPTQERKTKYLYYPMMYRMLKDATLLALFGFTCIMAYQTVVKESFITQYFLTVSVVLQSVAMIVFGREGRKDYVNRQAGKAEHDNISENTNELSFGKFEDESSSNRSSRMSTKYPPSPAKSELKLKSSKFQETDVDAC